jgi:hypothetical protein
MENIREDWKLFQSKLVRFMVKRAAVFLAVLSVADLAFLGNNRWLVLAGLTVGTLLSVARLMGNEWLFRKIFQLTGGKAMAGSILVFTGLQLILLPVILLVYLVSVWALYGFVAGVLAVPAVVMINSVTETFKMTKNNFEGR